MSEKVEQHEVLKNNIKTLVSLKTENSKEAGHKALETAEEALAVLFFTEEPMATDESQILIKRAGEAMFLGGWKIKRIMNKPEFSLQGLTPTDDRMTFESLRRVIQDAHEQGLTSQVEEYASRIAVREKIRNQAESKLLEKALDRSRPQRSAKDEVIETRIGELVDNYKLRISRWKEANMIDTAKTAPIQQIAKAFSELGLPNF